MYFGVFFAAESSVALKITNRKDKSNIDCRIFTRGEKKKETLLWMVLFSLF